MTSSGIPPRGKTETSNEPASVAIVTTSPKVTPSSATLLCESSTQEFQESFVTGSGTS